MFFHWYLKEVFISNHSNNKNIVIQKSHKGDSVVLLDKDKYLERMCKIINNNAKFELLQFDHGSEIIEIDYNHLYLCNSRPWICSLTKVHKPVADHCSSLRSILLAIS